MNIHLRNKIEKRSIAELRAQEMGLDYENMSDKEIFALVEEEEQLVELIKTSENKILEEDGSTIVQEAKILAEIAKAKEEAIRLSEEEQARVVEEAATKRLDAIAEGNSIMVEEESNSLKKEYVDIELEANQKEKQRLDYLKREEIRDDLQNKLIIEYLDSLNSYDNVAVEKKLAEEAEEKEVQLLEYIQREDIRFNTQKKYLKEALDNKAKTPKKESKITVSNKVLQTVLNSKKPVLIRRNALNASPLVDDLTKETKEREILSSSNLKASANVNIDVEKIVKSAIKEAVIELTKDKESNNYQYRNTGELSGIEVVNENGIKYISINGVKVDKQEKFFEALGIKKENDIKESIQPTINTDDVLKETKMESTESSIRKELKKKNRKKKRKTIITWFIILILIGGISYIYNFYNTNRRLPWTSQASVVTNVTNYTEVKVIEEETAPLVNINGVLEAYDLQNVVLRTSGAIKTINVKEGDSVKKGAVLVTVDDSSEQYNIANIDSQIKSAKLNGNANDVKLLELQLENAKNSLEYTTSVANFDGVVAQQGWTVGDYNSLSTTTNNSMIIADLSKFKATVQIDELDIGYVFVGQKAELTFDSLPGVVVEAEVSSIPMLGRYSTQGFGVLDVELTISNPPKRLKTGFTFSGKIIADGKESITVVNQAAVYLNGDKQYVKQKMTDGSLKEIQVTVRYLGENKVQILSGDIYVGDTVVIENQPSVEDAMRTRL
ncbi:MAG: efflux RND transporter periplasmic adaptor subunit [Spirochaetaceae bacterium]|nr:efflux RND transporter periplasmic adaptor subunit [Spirochaetaceae bacterium]